MLVLEQDAAIDHGIKGARLKFIAIAAERAKDEALSGQQKRDSKAAIVQNRGRCLVSSVRKA